MPGQRVVIVGGGVIGTASAYYLSKSGWDVELVDRDRFGAACSHGNCGLVCLSHVLPLTEPGAVGNALRAMFRKDAPFYIKPRLDPALWNWLLRFARRCNRRDMLEAADARHELLQSSFALYEELQKDEAIHCEWESNGLMFVFQTAKEMDHYEATDRMIRDRFDLGATRLDSETLLQREPALKPGIAGAWHYEMDAHLRPDRLMQAWRGVLEKRGVRIHENCPVHGFQTDRRRAVAVQTENGNIEADAVVVAAGAVTPFLQEHLGCRLPIQPGKGYSLTMPRPEHCPDTPMIFHEHRVAITPMQTGYRIGSTMEFVGYDSSLNPTRLEALKRSAAVYLKQPYCDPIEERWYGWRPMTTDGKPIIDRSPKLNNVMIAAGHNMLGLSMAPATGQLVAELLNERPPHLDPAPFRISRF